ncbi:MAG: VTT domain-containing protein [Lachnospiraceae bacterium]|nr:VTT domain-containing protein [Lachnospiraceae bacterium]
MSPVAKKIIRILSALMFIAVIGILLFTTYNVVTDKEAFKSWVDTHAVQGRVLYVLMVTVQIMVAVIPGGPIEVAGGYAFGAVGGIVLFIIGATIGSVLVFLLVRRFGRHIVEIYFSEHRVKKLDFLNEENKRDPLFFLLFLLPGAPKDLLCYVAGLTRMRFPVFLFICSFGRLPAVVGSAVSGYALGRENFAMAIIAFSITAALSIAGFFIYYFLTNRKHKDVQD